MFPYLRCLLRLPGVGRPSCQYRAPLLLATASPRRACQSLKLATRPGARGYIWSAPGNRTLAPQRAHMYIVPHAPNNRRRKETTTPTLSFVMPVLPGKEETDVETLERFSKGEERDAYVAARRSQGLTRESVWHQRTPDGILAIVMLEAEDLDSALRTMATSDEPFDRRFREFVQDVHGIELANDPPPDVRLVSDTRF